MTTKENAHPSAATLERAEMGTNFAGQFSCVHFNPAECKKQERFCVVDLLHQGRGNGLTLHDLVRITGIDEREIRRKIHAERKTGQLIMADCKNGYFLPENLQDIQQFARSMAHRASEILAVARAAEKAAAEAEGQISVGGW